MAMMLQTTEVLTSAVFICARPAKNRRRHSAMEDESPPTSAKDEGTKQADPLTDVGLETSFIINPVLQTDVHFCAKLNTFTLYYLAKSLLVIILLMNVGCSAMSLEQALCNAGTSAVGEPTYVTCLFGRNIADSRLGVNVKMFPLHSTKDISDTGKDVLLCSWQKNAPKCIVKDGYSFNYNISDRLTLEIPAATPEIAGMYMCHVVLEVSSPQACNLTVTERRESTPSSTTTNGTTGKATSTTAEPSETIGLGNEVIAFSLGLSVILIIGAAVAAVILLMFYKRIQSRLTLAETNSSCSDQTVEVQEILLGDRNAAGNKTKGKETDSLCKLIQFKCRTDR